MRFFAFHSLLFFIKAHKTKWYKPNVNHKNAKQVDSPSGAVALLVPAMAFLADTLAGHDG